VTTPDTDLGFSYRATAQGVVHISRGGREVVTLRADAAAKFLARAEGASIEALQQLCARATGNYKRGNESHAAHARGAKGRGG
jgi:hypothetical protein